MPSDHEGATFLASLLGVVLEPVTAQVGIQCSPITVIGSGGGASWCVILITALRYWSNCLTF